MTDIKKLKEINENYKYLKSIELLVLAEINSTKNFIGLFLSPFILIINTLLCRFFFYDLSYYNLENQSYYLFYFIITIYSSISSFLIVSYFYCSYYYTFKKLFSNKNDLVKAKEYKNIKEYDNELLKMKINAKKLVKK